MGSEIAAAADCVYVLTYQIYIWLLECNQCRTVLESNLKSTVHTGCLPFDQDRWEGNVTLELHQQHYLLVII